MLASAACFSAIPRAAECSPAQNPCCQLLCQMRNRTTCQADSLLLCSRDLTAPAVQVHNELGNSYNDVLSAQDLALFGGLTALATLERSELRSCVIDRISFREFLESHPQVRPLTGVSRLSRGGLGAAQHLHQPGMCLGRLPMTPISMADCRKEASTTAL